MEGDGAARCRRPWKAVRQRLSGGYEIDVGRLLRAAVGLASIEHGRDIEPVSLWWREVAGEFILERGRDVAARVRTLPR
jgi:hypothetical protein